MRPVRAGDSLEDFCRACKTDRMHTVVAADPSGSPLRVTCGYCGSEHHFRGGPRVVLPGTAVRQERATTPGAGRAATPPRPRGGADPLPLVSDRERTGPPLMSPTDLTADFEVLLRRIIREEAGVTPVVPAEKWRGGTLVLRPGTPGLQEKSWPIETFFHKVVLLRNRLRTLEQQVNASDLPEDAKVRLQAYVTACYGSLTSFNLLFADEEDQFRGTQE